MIATVSLPDNLATRSHEDGLPLSRVVRRSAADEVGAQLVALIDSGQLHVGDRLPSEADLARRFGVSRPIVREALGRLQALGLTESRPGSGTFVSSNVTRLTLTFGQYSASDLNEVRRCLEVPAARLAAVRRTNQDVDKLRLILDDEDKATSTDETISRDTDFHREIARATGNMLFVRLVEDLREILKEQTLAVSTLRNRASSISREHRAVLEAIIAGDGDTAAHAMNAHLDAVERAIRRIASLGSEASLAGKQGANRASPARSHKRDRKSGGPQDH
jgi:DNA-binding FadR family transcriptional regulator